MAHSSYDFIINADVCVYNIAELEWEQHKFYEDSCNLWFLSLINMCVCVCPESRLFELRLSANSHSLAKLSRKKVR